ncbi:MAG: outer membrane beta-barrel protein [Bacteroidales bacterium]|jgi:hypothetical protein|nr:outer membrane beta-barrel protein [Bacteroidales bacterium]
MKKKLLPVLMLLAGTCATAQNSDMPDFSDFLDDTPVTANTQIVEEQSVTPVVEYVEIVQPQQQYVAYMPAAQSQTWISRGWGIGVSGGIGFALGDISTESFSDAKYHLGFSVKKELLPHFDLKGNVMVGALEGSKDKYNGGIPADLRFRTDYVTYNALLQFRLTDLIVANEDAKFSMYLQAGAGMLHFRYALYKSGKTVIPESDVTTEITVPLGIGFECRFTPAFSIALDLTGHLTSATTLDGVKNSLFRDMMFTPSIGINYVFGKSSKTSATPTYQEVYVAPVQPVVEEVEIVEVIEEDFVELVDTTLPATEILEEFDFDDEFDTADIAVENATTQGQIGTQPQVDLQAQQIIDGRPVAANATHEGLIYRVQIAAVQHYNVTMAMDLKRKYALTEIPFEEIEGGYYKYTVGACKSLEEAMAYKETIVAKGIQDAFIVPYYVGKRISNQELQDILQR